MYSDSDSDDIDFDDSDMDDIIDIAALFGGREVCYKPQYQ